MFHVSLHIAHGVYFQCVCIFKKRVVLRSWFAFCACFMRVFAIVVYVWLHGSCTFTLFACFGLFCTSFAFFGTVILEYDDGHDYGDDGEEVVGEDDGHDDGVKF